MTLDRQRGTLLGLAVGDALGAPIEGERPGTFAEITGYRENELADLAAGEWTDDTSMALALADSIAHAGWDLNDQARRYLAWCRHGEYSVKGRCFSIGMTTAGALARFHRSGDAYTAGDPSEDAASNGSVMRLAPVPIRYAGLFPDKVEELARLCIESSQTTHASPQCLSACAYMGMVVAAMIQGVDRDEALAPDWTPLRRLHDAYPLHPNIAEVAEGTFRRKQPPEIVGSGYVVKTLEAALWAFHDATDFPQAVLRVVNLGDDADTTGAVCGQFAGAFWGETAIPVEWRRGLAGREIIEPVLSKLVGNR